MHFTKARIVELFDTMNDDTIPKRDRDEARDKLDHLLVFMDRNMMYCDLLAERMGLDSNKSWRSMLTTERILAERAGGSPSEAMLVLASRIKRIVATTETTPLPDRFVELYSDLPRDCDDAAYEEIDRLIETEPDGWVAVNAALARIYGFHDERVMQVSRATARTMIDMLDGSRSVGKALYAIYGRIQALITVA